MKRYNYG